jgi:uncharacterized protein YbaR (Trm112 family)
MKHTFLNKLACPFDKSDLSLKIIREDGVEIIEGILTCDQCGRYYPIVHGIPVMSPDEYRETSLEKPILEKWGERISVENNVPKFQLVQNAEEKRIR